MTQRVQRVTGGDGAAEREIDDTDVVLGLQRDRSLNCGNHGAVGAGARAIEDTQVHNVEIGCDAPDGVVRGLGRGLVPIAADETDYHLAVSVEIGGFGVVRDETLVVKDAAVTLGVREVSVGIHSAIDYGHTNTCPVPR